MAQDFTPRYRTILGLIEMRKAGRIKAIYCNGGALSITRANTELEIRDLTSWSKAANLVEKFHKELTLTT